MSNEHGKAPNPWRSRGYLPHFDKPGVKQSMTYCWFWKREIGVGVVFGVDGAGGTPALPVWMVEVEPASGRHCHELTVIAIWPEFADLSPKNSVVAAELQVVDQWLQKRLEYPG